MPTFDAAMSPIYEEVCGELGRPVDAARLAEMRAANEKALEELEAKIADAGGCWMVLRMGGWVGNLGWLARAACQLQHPPAACARTRSPAWHATTAAAHLPRRGQRGRDGGAGRAESQGGLPVRHRGPCRRAERLCSGGGQDCGGGAQDGSLVCTDQVGGRLGGDWPAVVLLWGASTPLLPTPRTEPACRLELSRGDLPAVKAGLEKARALCDKGGDWERKNKLKVGLGFVH